VSLPSFNILAAVLALTFAVSAIAEEQRAPDGAAAPDANAVNEQQLLQRESRIEGRIDIPSRRADVLIQPAGRRWDYFHEITLHWVGAIVILGMIVLLGLAFLISGPLRISAGRSGKKIKRFSAFERFSHWLTAVSFVLLGLTGKSEINSNSEIVINIQKNRRRKPQTKIRGGKIKLNEREEK